MSDDFKIFISYARNDNEPPPDVVDAKGFVTFFHDQLKHALRDLGATNIKLWRDEKNIGDADQFEPSLEDAIAESSILLVVMSPNWMSRPYCRRELDAFGKRWQGEGELRVKARTIVVWKRPVERNRLPSLLQGQVGVSFFPPAQDDENASDHEYFWRGKVRDERYHDSLKKVASHLLKASSRLYRQDRPNIEPVSQLAPPLFATGRTIYVAQPASDMRVSYERVVRELRGLGHAIVPDKEIPDDRSAVAFIDEALKSADMAVHLLGTKLGYTPEGVAPIVRLQLERAALRAVPGDSEATQNERMPKPHQFRRVVWAPRILDPEQAMAPTTIERDPLAVLSAFAPKIATDKIDGQGLSKFVDFLKQTVEVNETVPQPLSDAPDSSRARVYLYHRQEDSTFGFDLANALQSHEIEAVLPALEGKPGEINAFHRKSLAECDAVVLCWAYASEAWVRAQWSGMRNWRDLKRKKQFTYRGVVAGPPPGARKKQSKLLFSPSEHELIVDLTDSTLSVSEALDPLVRRVVIASP